MADSSSKDGETQEVDGEALFARLNRLQEAMELHAKQMKELESSGDEDSDEDHKEEDDCAGDSSKAAERVEADGIAPKAADGSVGTDGASAAAAAAAAAKRRRRLDQTWQVEAERDFEARTGEDSSAPDAGRGEAIASELRILAKELQELPGPPLPTPGESSTTAVLPAAEVKSSLRRLKQVEAEVAVGIEKECGMNISRGLDVYRLVLNNPKGALRSTTRVLLVTAGEAFLCEEPISEETSTEPDPLSATGCSEGQSSAATAERAVSSSWIEVELRYFRAVPKRGAIPQRLGRLPTLHVAMTTDDGLHQAMEFIGVHQRRYYAEDPPSDAISRNLTESLLRVALEFVFHPSRSKFAKEKVILRECSLDAEALHSREVLLPRMAENIRRLGERNFEVSLEFRDPSQPSSRFPCREGSTTRKDKSFLVLDEDVVKVSPAKEQFSAKAPAAKTAFKGLGQGFLNSDKAKRKGLSTTGQKALPTSEGSASSSAAPPCVAEEAASVADRIPPGERTRINPSSEGSQSAPPPVQTCQEEKQKLLLGAAEPAPGEVSARAVASSLREKVVEEDEELDLEDDSGPVTLSDLANQLFGMDLDELESQSQQTESTEMPSPQAVSRDGGTLSEHSESATEAQPATAPASGVRLLQQRRRERLNNAAATATGESQAPAAASQPAPSRASSTPDDLVALWMKQRW